PGPLDMLGEVRANALLVSVHARSLHTKTVPRPSSIEEPDIGCSLTPPVAWAGRCQRLHAYWRRHIAGTEERPMAARFQLVIDCADPEPLARFWAAALGYELEPPPDGFASWDAYWRDLGVPEDELGTGAD